MSEETQNPTVEHLHSRTVRHESEIAALKRGQDELHSSFAALATDVNRKFEKIVDLVQTKTEQKPTNWLALIAAFAAVVGLMLQHVSLVMAPERARIDKAEHWIDNRRTELKADYQRFGEVIADCKRSGQLADVVAGKVDNLVERVARLEGENAVKNNNKNKRK